LSFADDYWDNLTSDQAFLGRVCVDYCHANAKKYPGRMDELVPEATKLGFLIDEIFDTVVTTSEKLFEATLLEDDEEREKLEEMHYNTVPVLADLLRLVAKLDYSDEIGRRKMYSVVGK
jgi:condensin complex subunit 3